MIFLPLKVDLDLHRLPVVSLAVALICVFVFYLQLQSDAQNDLLAQQYCQLQMPPRTIQAMDRLLGAHDPELCELLFWHLRSSGNADVELQRLVDHVFADSDVTEQDNTDYVYVQIQQRYQEFLLAVPDSLTRQLWYRPDSWNPWNMLTAAFAHSSWLHLIGNLFFFIAFAMAAEIFVGSLALAGLILLYAVGTHLVYSIAMVAASEAIPTVGLSGVVMAVVALVSYFLPRGRIRCLLWIIFYVRVFAVPIWLFAGWFIGWDLFDLLTDDGQSGINFIAHVSGAVLGYLSGLVLFHKRKLEIQALVKGEAEDFRWLDEMHKLNHLEHSGQLARKVQALNQLITDYPQRETELRMMRQSALHGLNATQELCTNGQRLLDLLLDDQRMGEAAQLYLQAYQQNINIKPVRSEHYLALFRLLLARTEYHAALALASGFHRNFTSAADISQLYYEVARLYQHELNQPQKTQAIIRFLRQHYPDAPATQQAMLLPLQ